MMLPSTMGLTIHCRTTANSLQHEGAYSKLLQPVRPQQATASAWGLHCVSHAQSLERPGSPGGEVQQQTGRTAKTPKGSLTG